MDNPAWKQTLENEMVVELSKHLNPRLKDWWADFDRSLSTYLGAVCRARLQDFHQAFDKLRNDEVISIGDYKNLRDMVNPIHVDMGKIIDKYTVRMQARDEESNSMDWKENDTEGSEEMKNLENEMVVKLSKHLHPRLKEKWENFDCSLSEYLDEVCRARMENISMVIDELKRLEKISIGDYTVLREMVQPIHVIMGDIIDEYTAKIKSLSERGGLRD